jgi:hypothetical protein
MSQMRITMIVLVRICLLEFWRSPDVLGEVRFSKCKWLWLIVDIAKAIAIAEMEEWVRQ